MRLVRAHLAKLSRGDASDFKACRRVALGGMIDTKVRALFFPVFSFCGVIVL